MPIIDAEMLERLSAMADSGCTKERSGYPCCADDEDVLSAEKIERPRTDRGCAASASAFERIVKLVSVRERCTAELRDRLIREDFPESEVASALGRAVECGLVDDGRFADVLIRTRMSQGRGKRGIQAELDRFGIPSYEVAGWPDAYFDPEGPDECERALDLLRRHPPRSKNIRQSAFRKLISKGFDASVASRAVSIYVADMENGS